MGSPKNKGKDALAGRLQALFVSRDDIKISRSHKTAECRVSNLDDAMTAKKITEAVAAGWRLSACGWVTSSRFRADWEPVGSELQRLRLKR